MGVGKALPVPNLLKNRRNLNNTDGVLFLPANFMFDVWCSCNISLTAEIHNPVPLHVVSGQRLRSLVDNTPFGWMPTRTIQSLSSLSDKLDLNCKYSAHSLYHREWRLTPVCFLKGWSQCALYYCLIKMIINYTAGTWMRSAIPQCGPGHNCIHTAKRISTQRFS